MTRRFAALTVLFAMALALATACGKVTEPTADDPNSKYVGGIWLTRDIVKPEEGWDVVFKEDNTFEASMPARPEVKIYGPYALDAAGNVTGTFTANMGGRVGKIEARLESNDTILYFRFIETNAFDNPHAVNGVVATENRGPNPTKPVSPGSKKPPAGDAADIDPAKVNWLRVDASGWPVNSTVDFSVTSITNHDKPTICWNSSNPSSWLPDPSGKTVGNLWIFLNINNAWYATPIEWLLTGQGRSACSLMENIPPQAPFIQGKVEPLASYHPKSGEKVGLMVSALPSGWGGRGAYERSRIVMATFP